MKNRSRLFACLAAIFLWASSTVSGQSFATEFTSGEGMLNTFGEYEGQEVWTLDTSGDGTLNFSADIAASAINLDAPEGSASVQLQGWLGLDFVLLSRFTLNDLGNLVSGSRSNTIGFGFFGEDEGFTGSSAGGGTGPAYYLADLIVGGANNGRLTLRKQGEHGGGFSGGSSVFIDIVEGATYEMRVTGSYDTEGTLTIRMEMFDGAGALLATRIGTDTMPLEGEHFGYRHRIVWGSERIDIDFHDFLAVADGLPIGAGPAIVDLVPAGDTLFHSAGEGLHFTVTAAEGEEIEESGIELLLNGEPVPPEELAISGESPAFSVSFSGLDPNQFYVAEVVAVDTEGRESFRSWRFDTLDGQTAFVIEAEDYNFAANIDCDAFGDPVGTPVTGGSFINDPLPSTFDAGSQTLINYNQNGTPVGYVDRVGVPGIDFHDTHTQGSAPDGDTGDIDNTMYRFCDPVGTQDTADFRRPKYEDASIAAGVYIPDYHVHRVQTGEWLNYTRVFPEGDYRVYLRAAATGSPSMRLSRVTGDPSIEDQQTETLGDFIPVESGPFTYVPLTDPDLGQPMILSLNGQDTLRLTAVSANNNIHLNFLVFVPVTLHPPAVVSVAPAGHSGNVPPAAAIEAHIDSGSDPLDLGAIRLLVNGAEAPASVTATSEGAIVSYTHGSLPPLTNTARVEFDDQTGSGPYSLEWSFSVRPEVTTFYALAFDGVQSFVDITDVAGAFGDFTISGWFNIGEQPENQFLYRITNQESNTRYIGLTENEGVLTALLRPTQGGATYSIETSDFEYDTWVHIAFVREGDQLRLYLDGVEAGSTTAVDTVIVAARKSYLGANPHPWAAEGSFFFRGFIDEFQIWSVARTAQQIAASMFEPLHEPIEPGDGLHARFGFNEGSGDQAFDYSSGSGAVAHVNAVWVPSEIFESEEPPDLPVLRIGRGNGNVTLTWDETGLQLETATDLNGPWTVVGGVTSPYIVDTNLAPWQFFRLRAND